MSAKTKIVVLQLKELIYTGIFIVLGILFIILLVIILKPKDAPSSKEESSLYIPGKYTTSLVLNDTAIDVEVSVSADAITSICMNNLDEAVSVMYPLMEPALEELSTQIIETQSLDNLTYSDDNKYTSMVLLNAITQSLEQASATPLASATPETTVSGEE